MLIRKRRGWEPPESAATPEHLFHQRRRLIQGWPPARSCSPAAGLGWRAAAAQDADPTAGLYPVAAQSALPARPSHPRAQRRKAGHHLQQLLRVRLAQADLAGGAGAPGPALDRDPGRHGRTGADARRSTICSGRCRSRNAGLSPPLRRGVVDGGALERLPAARRWSISRARSAARNTCAWRPSSTRTRRPVRSSSGTRGRMSRG